MSVDFERPFEASQMQSWEQEYCANVTALTSAWLAEEIDELGFVEPDCKRQSNTVALGRAKNVALEMEN